MRWMLVPPWSFNHHNDTAGYGGFSFFTPLFFFQLWVQQSALLACPEMTRILLVIFAFEALSQFINAVGASKINDLVRNSSGICLRHHSTRRPPRTRAVFTDSKGITSRYGL